MAEGDMSSALSEFWEREYGIEQLRAVRENGDWGLRKKC